MKLCPTMGESFETTRERDRTVIILQLFSAQAIYMLGNLPRGSVQRCLVMSDGIRNERKHDIHGFL